MAAFIPEDKIQEVQHASDILEIVSESIVLKKTGKNYQGLCPFHAEKTPSFSVNPSKQIFYCFGCGTGGNVFSFLMKKEGLSFPEAVRDLARRYGVHIPTTHISPEQKRKMTERDQVMAVNRLAMEFFQRNLKSASGDKAKRYLEKRGLRQETIDALQLGFAPDGWENLAGFLRNKKVPYVLGEKSGLIVRRKNGTGHYDAFRNRIIFPIFNMSRQVVGFGGRVLDDALPKYLNSPETPVYNKRRSLYGIDRAKQPARDAETVYVVEGYLDLLAMFQHGMRNSVATLGTALTGDHVKLLQGLIGRNGRVVLVFDSDTAGIRAAERSIEVFAKANVNAYILVLGEEHDPDSFLNEYGSDKFLSAAAASLDSVSFLIETAVKRHGLSIEGKLRIVDDLKGTLANIDDPVALSLYVKALSERIGVDESAIMEKIYKTPKRTPGSDHSPRIAHRFAGTSNGLPKPIEKQDRMEARIVAMMFHFPSLIEEIRLRHLVDLFDNNALKLIARTILENEAVWTEPAALVSKFESDDVRALAASLAIDNHQWDAQDEIGCKKLMAQFESNRSRQRNMLLRDIKAAEAAEDQDTLVRLLKEKQDLARKQSLPF